MDIIITDQLEQILGLFIKTLKIKGHDLCPCGSRKKSSKCCLKKDSVELLFIEDEISKLLAFKKSKSGVIYNIPLKIWNSIQQRSLSRFTCLHGNCENNTVSCHLVPENILKQAFGKKCLDYRLEDKRLKSSYQETIIQKAGTLNVFCSQHDNDIFKEIDELEIDLNNKKHLFLLRYKAISFSLRKLQFLLGIDFQVELLKPYLYLRNSQEDSNKNINLNLDHYKEQYIRFNMINNLYIEAMGDLENNSYNRYTYIFREIKFDEDIYFFGLITILNDMQKNRIKLGKHNLNMNLFIYKKDRKLYIIFGGDRKYFNFYRNLFIQIEKSDTENLTSYIKELLSINHDKPILGVNNTY